MYFAMALFIQSDSENNILNFCAPYVEHPYIHI